jgi:hypothetical protein
LSGLWTDRRRRASTALAVVLALGWYLGPAPWLADGLQQSLARSVAKVQLHDVILAVARSGEQDPASLPHGADATHTRELLELALVRDGIKSSWTQRAAAALGPELLRLAVSSADRPPLPRSPAHPNVPAELFAIEQALSSRFGSWGGPPPPAPAEDLWLGMPPDDQAKGLLAMVLASELTQAQARGLQGAVLLGLQAYDQQPGAVLALGSLLGPRVLARAPASHGAPSPDLVPRHGPAAVDVLRRREAIDPGAE